MDKKELMEQFIMDYDKFFTSFQMKGLEETITNFLNENRELSNNDFFKKFKKEFTTVKLIDNAISRTYLQRISSDVKVIKIIVVIYFIGSIILGIWGYIELNRLAEELAKNPQLLFP